MFHEADAKDVFRCCMYHFRVAPFLRFSVFSLFVTPNMYVKRALDPASELAAFWVGVTSRALTLAHLDWVSRG